LYAELLADARFHALLLAFDEDLAAQTRAAGCARCGAALHAGHFPRKPRFWGARPAGVGGTYDRRLSFCCAMRECRKRRTAPSLRFLGRRVWLGAVVVLVAAMQHGLTPARVGRLGELVGVSRRTMARWRAWWLKTFVATAFWRAAAAKFMPPVEMSRQPAALLDRFAGDAAARLVALLRFLGPITGGKTMHAF